MELILSKEEYKKMQSWKNFYSVSDGKIVNSLKFNPIDKSWNTLFQILFNSPKFEETEKNLKILQSVCQIYPKPEVVFEAFNITGFNHLKVVFIGQDPYFNSAQIDVPQAMGLAFSVPVGVPVPSSLENIFKNMIKYGHRTQLPEHGNLSLWGYQGCLLLNTILTVQHGSPNSHQEHWAWFTNTIIKYISDNCEKMIFVMWGSKAYDKINFIDQNKHNFIVSSHPSGLSANKSFRKFPPFNDFEKSLSNGKPFIDFTPFNNFDHFSEINNLLKKQNKTIISW
jgi:uracil-DNA glycosylase